MTTTIEVNERTDVILPAKNDPNQAASAVSWGAIFAGATAAAALSLILLILGTGLGFSAMSPWANDGASAETLGVSGILWITLTSLAASGLGGYLAGRLRTRWASLANRDEVYFRDTAHGFLAWAVATLITAGLLASTVTALVTGGIKAGASIAKGVATSAAVAGAAGAANADRFGMDGEATGYFIDTLFRSTSTNANTTSTNPANSTPSPDTNDVSSAGVPPTDASTAALAPTATTSAPTPSRPQNAEDVPTAEVARIFINAMRNDSLPESDAQYLGQIVAEHTDLPQADAEQRVRDTYNQWQTQLREAEKEIKETADEARETTAYISLWFFVSLLIGAFTASWMATFGGRQRDL